MTVLSVDICICTFRRPFLRETLRSVSDLSVAGVQVRVIVSDNDTGPSAKALVDQVAANFPFPMTYLHSPAANISIARNACLDAASAECIAFLDDDEVVTPNWLTALLRAAETTGSEVVLGPVRAIYGASAPRWLVEGDFHSTRPVVSGGKISTGYTCNVLMRWTPPFNRLRFSEALGKSGGEDTDFFYRVSDLGGRISFAADAWVEEPVPAARAALGWLLRRRLRSGQTHGVRLQQARQRTFLAVAVAAGKAMYCFGAAATTLYSPVAWRRNLLRGTLHVGVIGGLVGINQAAHYGQPASS